MAKSSLNSAAKIAIQLQQLSNEATEKSFQYNREEATTARNWQKEMSDTSHQREVQDLIKAGLNPVLSSGGSGAQSYTTSSASAQAENAAGAVANIYGSEMSADATRAAAAASAKATRYAAAQQAAAARYAASMQYAASVYHSDRAKEATIYKAKADYKGKKYAVDHAKTGNLYGIMSNSFDSTMKGLQQLGNNQIKSSLDVIKNQDKYLKNPSKGFSFGNLNIAGRQFVNKQLKKWNVGTSNKVYKMYVNAFLNQKKSAMKSWTSYVKQRRQQQSNAANRISAFRGYL